MTVIQFPARGRFLKAKKSASPPQKTGRNTRTYLEVRDREYLFEEEVKAMIQVAFKGRWGHRDSTLILMGYRHGLRISELVNLRWQQINFNTGTSTSDGSKVQSLAFTRCQARKCGRWGSCGGIILIQPTYLFRRGAADDARCG
jgi:integrase